MKRVADRTAQAESYQARGQAALESPAAVLGKSPMRRARDYFERAVQLQPDRATSIGDHLLRHGETREAIRFKMQTYVRLAGDNPLRAPLATQIGDAHLQASHESRLCYNHSHDLEARRYYNQAIAADLGYYPAHIGRYATFIDEYHHSRRVNFWRRHPAGDVYLYEQALIEWATVLTQAPQAVLKDWLRHPGELFEQKATPRTTFIYRDYIVPALGGVLVPTSDALGSDEELTRLALVCVRHLIEHEPWTISYIAPYLLEATQTAGLTSINLPELLRIYDKIAHAPLQQGSGLADAARRLRHRFSDDSGAMLQLVAFQKILLDAYSQVPSQVLKCLRELSKLARDNVPVAFEALDLMLTTVVTHPALAADAIDRVARRAAQIADSNIADSDALVFHIIDQLRLMANHPNGEVSRAVAVALQGPLRKYYDAYRAAEDDARQAREDADDRGNAAAPEPPKESPTSVVPSPEQPAEEAATQSDALVLKPRRHVTFAPRTR